MLEGLAAWVLNNYIGEYVENLNTHQLSIGVFQGQIELENLPLKKSALKKFDLPLEVRSGFVGKILLSIPVKRLRSEPWVITLDKLYLVAGPLQNQQYNESEEKEQENTTKQTQLRALEEKWKTVGKSYYGSMWSVTPMMTNVLENIQLKVRDVHIRYEDDTTIPGTSFACGFTIKSLSVQSTDGSWMPKFVSRNDTDMMRKLVDLQEFSMYWDTDSAMFGHLDRSQMEDALQRPMGQSAKTGEFRDHEFLVEPVSAQARMKRNTSDLPLRSANMPRIHFDVQLEKIPVSLSEPQYRGLMAWIEEFTRYEKKKKHRKWKPMCKIKEQPRQWWHYAIQANLHSIKDRNKRRSVGFVTQRCRDIVLYVEAYIDYVAIGTAYMENRLKEHMEQMEEELSFDELKILREIGRTKMTAVAPSTRTKPAEPTDEGSSGPAEPSVMSNKLPTTPDTPTTAPTSPTSPSTGSPPTSDSVQSQGLFQRWFPGWGGWYGTSEQTSPDPVSLEPDVSTPTDTQETDDDSDQDFEREVYDLLNDTAENQSLLKRDIVLAKVNFELQSGVFRLLQGGQDSASKAVMLEMECSNILVNFESRPRTNGMKFGISVGGLYLRDKITTNSIMPVLVSPQHKVQASTAGRPFSTGVLSSNIDRASSDFQSILTGGSSLFTNTDQVLFELLYEKKPFDSKADYRLEIKTRPLDIVYNPATIGRVKEFFSVQKSQSEIELAVTAKNKYEAIKKQTEEELKHTFDELLDEKIKGKRWNVKMDIAAPQIIVPQDFSDSSTTLVVFDMGHLMFQNMTAGIKDDIKASEEDEDFVTPSSTPPEDVTEAPSDTAAAASTLSEIFGENLSEAVIRDKIYDKYTLNLSDLQVMVGTAKDNWRFAHSKGTSHMHVMDKFSISLQFHRRLLYTSDPQWPKASVAGTLPKLTLHLNEQKILALHGCVKLLGESTISSSADKSTVLEADASHDGQGLDQSMYYSVYQAYSKSIQSVSDTEDQDTKQVVAESKKLVMQFAINQVSVEIQSRGRSIAELQVSQVNANMTTRPYDTSVSFCIHSLLVVDALQTYGQDFELLVASHKCLFLDTQSGSMVDSEPTSPLSHRSPVSPCSPAEPAKPVTGTGSKTSVHAAVSTALEMLAMSDTAKDGEHASCRSPTDHLTVPTSPNDPHSLGLFYPTSNTDALIKVELDIICPDCPSNTTGDDTLHIANVQFNSLDFIANQQTLVELLGFFKRVFPSTPTRKDQSRKKTAEEENFEKLMKDKAGHYELTAEFHRLNILLMRVEEKGKGRKVATATMSEAKIDVTMLQGQIEVEGSLGGLQFQNLTPDAERHAKVLSMGTNPYSVSSTLTSPRTGDPGTSSIHRSSSGVAVFLDSDCDKAFTFQMLKPKKGEKFVKDAQASPEYRNVKFNKDETVVKLKMASVWYTHSPYFLKEISMCLTEFNEYMTNVGSSIKAAATEMAIGLVNQCSESSHAALLYGSRISLPGMDSTVLEDINEDDDVNSLTQSFEEYSVLVDHSTIKLDVNLQTPVILFPRKPDSSEVLVAHLGKICIRNFDQPSATVINGSPVKQQLNDTEKIYVEIRDMSLYSVDLDKQHILEHEGTDCEADISTSVFHMPQPGGYIKTSYGIPILHDTVLELVIEKQDQTGDFINQSEDVTLGASSMMSVPDIDCDLTSSVLQVTGRVMTPLKLALSKHVYEQILQTMDNITPEEPSVPRVGDGLSRSASAKDVSDNGGPPVHASVSALKLEVGAPKPAADRPADKDMHSSPSSSTAAKLEETTSILCVNFEMPVFNVEMTGDLGEGIQKGLVDLKLENFIVNFEKRNPFVKSIELSLESLVMEDLLQDKSSKHRYLMVSTHQTSVSQTDTSSQMHISQSCPTSMIDVPLPDLPPSLPSSFHRDNVFNTNDPARNSTKPFVRRAKSASDCPQTPPPSRLDSRRGSLVNINRLVHIKMTLVDRKSPVFESKYNKTNRFVDVNFNGLDTNVNLQTWVVLLDFLGLGAKVQNPEDFRKSSHSLNTESNIFDKTAKTFMERSDQNEVTNSEINLKVQCLSLFLNKKEYELARATVSRFDSHVSLRDGNFAIKGQLGSMSLQDESPQGNMYKERFMTTGSQAVDFDIFKYGTPDPDLDRPHDISVKLRMSSVWYVHTQRFLQEVLAFCQHFNQLQDVLGRSRAASAGQKIAVTASRGSRISINVEAGAPIILIPHSSKSTDILVMDLGTLSIHNTFLYAGAEGTISHKNLKSSALPDNNDAPPAPPSEASVDVTSQLSMTQSSYGSLDLDWRGFEMEPANVLLSPSNSLNVSGATSDTTLTSNTTGSLTEFYSALGGSFGGSSSIGTKSKSRESTSSFVTAADSSGSIQQLFKGFVVEEPQHVCLLDIWSVDLNDMDLFSAEWISSSSYNSGDRTGDLVFETYVVRRKPGKVLQSKCRLSLQVERNLEGDISHNVPDFSIDGKLTSVYFQLDLNQYQLIRGILAHNFGEQLEPFQRPMMSQLQDPRIHTVLSGDVWTAISITIDLDGVTAELLIAHEDVLVDCPETSLARFDFISSRLSFQSSSDGSKVVDLVSNEIKLMDTRYKDSPVNVRPNVFPEILKPSKDRSHPDALQMELHFRSNKTITQFTILLNNMRVMGIFDWLLSCKDFLLTGPDDPYKNGSEGSGLDKNEDQNNSFTGGIMTKRGDHLEQKKETFELRLNVTDTELVVVEDATDKDTNAVILKSTAVFTYKPKSDHPVSCSLQSLEVFSCSLAAEDETALSIIDPMSITMELNGSTSKKKCTIGPAGLLDAAVDNNQPPVFEISFTTLNIRLSYNDMKLFLAILKTVPKQLLQATKQNVRPPKNAVQCKYPVEEVNKLSRLGFDVTDCEKALDICKGILEDAALWLTDNATPVQSSVKADSSAQANPILSGFEVKVETISLVFIDDCLDADVPLAELTFSNLYFLHNFFTVGKGNSEFRLSGDYYNRALSGWEPFIESWGCSMKWSQDTTSDENKLSCTVYANNVLNINITSALLEQYAKTKVKWTEDYYKQTPVFEEEGVYNNRKRVPFIPYIIRNHTGCKMWFATMTTTPTRICSESSPTSPGEKQSQYKISGWTEVMKGTERAFLFEEREKIRHQHTHKLKVHQLVVQVEGWREMSPVSVDKVGTYFRTARPEVNPTGMNAQPMARIVFDVTLEGSARKVITVRSGIMLHNRLQDDVEIRLENTLALSPVHPEQNKMISVASGSRQAVPLPMVHSRMWMRPQGWSLDWCQKPVLWQHVSKPGEFNDSINTCDTEIFAEAKSYRFCVATYRQHFPESKFNPVSGQNSPGEGPVYSHPGHVITLMPPVRMENLLPVEMTYNIRTSGSVKINGTVKPGQIASLVVADLTQTLELSISLDNFTTCKELVIPPGTLDYKVKMVLSDRDSDRPLELTVMIKAGMGGSLKLSVSAPYWLVNKTGLPLIFKQDGAKTAAGQFEEHELARSVTPLLFSFTEKDKSFMCQMRLGKYVHGVKSLAQWCHRFSLERGCGVRDLHVTPPSNRPDWVYMIGIEVRQGRGRYYQTNIITCCPRYQLDNRSSHKLAFAQRYAVQNWSPSSVDYFSALPNCTLSFHWPRVDKDNLLCIKLMDDPEGQWSGGFMIDRVESFHVNIRTKENRCNFLRVDIVLQGATFFVVFSDADHMPPPYRIENFSEVPVLFYQTRTKDDRLRTVIRPLTQVPYALDEPVLPPHLTVKVIGGSAATYNMNNVKDGDQLYYENHIYLAFTGTFKRRSVETLPQSASWSGVGCYLEQHELVLDVLPNNRVVLKKKETGKRSQLWRMTSTGMLQHEGSAVPRDPRKPSSTSTLSYVLDIQDIALQPSREMSLTVRKAEDRRKSSQTWMFTRDGRLCCGGKPNLCVQAKNGFFGLRDGEEAILGPTPPTIKSRQDVPIEMAVHNEKSRPGSGQLSVKVLTDGPTRVLRITDVTQQQLKSAQKEDWIVVNEKRSLPNLSQAEEEKLNNKARMLEVSVDLPAGIGISLVNKKYEELIYMSMTEIRVHYYSSKLGQDMDIAVNKFQIDNQLIGRYQPILLFVSPFNKNDDEEDKGPAVQISINKVPNSQWNADIYKHLVVVMKRLTMQLEETLLWKLLQFFGFKQTETELEDLTETGIDSNKEVAAATSSHLKRYYFGTLKVDLHRMMLSMYTASHLSPDLVILKRSLGIPLVKFADAQVDLEPFVRHHPFETSMFLMESVQFHFTEELKSQAASILGSVDFLGNPLGFFNDVAEGVSGLLEGNVGGLFKNVTHGVSNSAAKVTGSLSDGLGVATLDHRHQKIRQQIRDDSQGQSGASSSGHLIAGIKGLGHGLFGGLTSIVSQTYTGAKSDGIEGFMTGLGKGVLGTVTKPVAGVLDFASGAASAVRDTSRSSSKVEPRRIRKSRVTHSAGGLLISYSDALAEAQETMYKHNRNNYHEVCIAMEMLRVEREDSLRALISTEHVYFLGKSPRDKENIILQPSYRELLHCRAISVENKHYLELTIKTDSDRGTRSEVRKAPLVRCDQEAVAQRVAQQINYAKVLYDEVRHTLPPDSGREED